jgi:hypothetical protein
MIVGDTITIKWQPSKLSKPCGSSHDPRIMDLENNQTDFHQNEILVGMDGILFEWWV